MLTGLLFLLPCFGINVPIWVVVVASLGWAAWAYIGYSIGAKILAKKPVSGIEAMVGTRCRTITPLSPDGYVRAGSELWKAHFTQEYVGADVDVMIVGVKGLIVHVSLPPDNGTELAACTTNTSLGEQ